MSTNKKADIEQALTLMLEEGAKINPNAVAKRAGTTPANLRHFPELHSKIKLLKEQQQRHKGEVNKDAVIIKQKERIKQLEAKVEMLTAKLEVGSDPEAMQTMMACMVEVYRAYDDVCANANDLVNLLEHTNSGQMVDINTGEILKSSRQQGIRRD